MTLRRLNRSVAGVFLGGLLAGCGAGPAPATLPTPAPSFAPSASEVDIEFLEGMIHHHSQAVVMASLAATNGANEQVQVLSERIIVSQDDEIALMELWLRDHGVEPPVITPMDLTGDAMDHDHGHASHGTMPGMATHEEMMSLAAARGQEFDRLFLTLMIRHHEGALEMVDTLFATDGGGIDDMIYKFASDTFADQGSEIDRMQRMLDAMPAR